MALKNDLDKYGVWIKKAPKTVDSESETTAEVTTDDFSLDEISSDLPDFSDINIDTNSEEPSETFDIEEPAPEPEPEVVEESTDDFSFGEEEEISLDDFLDGGFSESKDAFEASLEETEKRVAEAQNRTQQEEPAVQEEPAPAAEESVEEEISLDDFGMDMDAPEETVQESATQEEVSFGSVSDSEEEISLDDFGVDFSDDNIDARAEFENSQATETTETQEEDAPLDIDLSFDEPSDTPMNVTEDSFDTVDFSTETSNDTVAEDVSLDSFGDTENISLEDFGFDINAPESSSEDTSSLSPAPSETIPAPAESTSSNDDFTVMTDDDIDISSEPAEKTEIHEEAVQNSGEDDFDVDSLLNDIQDENGNTVSFDDDESDTAAAPEFEDSAIEEPVVVENTFEDIPDTFDEETNSILSEFEESQEAIEETSTEEIIEEPVFEDVQEPVSKPVENEIIEEPVFDDIQEPVSEEPAIDQTPVIPEPSIETTPVSPAPQAAQNANDATADILRQIMGELSSLKSEISGLKSDLANLKEKESLSSNEVPDFDSQMEIENAINGENTTEENTGFFADDDGDDTIALSGDELNNIINTAEFETEEVTETEENAEEIDENAVQINEENSEQDAFETIDDSIEDFNDTESTESETPAEIEIPVEDDILQSAETETIETIDSNTLTEDSDSFGGFVSEQDAEKEAAQLSIKFEDEKLEEPSDLDLEIELDDEIPSELPDEIMVPKDESIEDAPIIDEPVPFTEPENDIEFSENLEMELGEISANDGFEEITGSALPQEEDISIDSDLTADKLNYLNDDKNIFHHTEPAVKQEEAASESIPGDLKNEIVNVLTYMDSLLENLPEDKITEFAQSEQFEAYKKLFKDLGLA